MKLSSLKNIGQEIERKLNNVGIENVEDLKAVGSQEAFFRLKIHYPEVCLVHLYVLQGAIDSIDYNKLSETVKKELKKFSDSLKK